VNECKPLPVSDARDEGDAPRGVRPRAGACAVQRGVQAAARQVGHDEHEVRGLAADADHGQDVDVRHLREDGGLVQ